MTMPERKRQDLTRVLRPKSVAFVGVSENSAYASNVWISLEGDADLYFVHPRYTELFGRPCYPTLADIGTPIDAVFTATSAKGTVAVAKEAADIGAGGLITFAGGFAESGAEGAALQRELQDIAASASMPVVGPNGVGVVNAQLGLSMSMMAPFARRAGGVSGVFHSGSMVEAVSAAADFPGGLGTNLLISSGNEAVTDMADFVEYLIDDDQTRVILLGIESIRRPEAFFAAAERALTLGVPIIAVKTGRSERSQKMAASHTGSIVGDAWVYDVAFRQAGIQVAEDVDEAVVRAQLLERLPRERWTRGEGLAVLTTTGGFAQLASDLAELEGVTIPELPSLATFVKENIPGSPDLTNPIDGTGFAWSDHELWERMVEAYASCDDVDSIWFPSQHNDWDEVQATSMVETFVRIAKKYNKPFLLSSLGGRPGAWLEKYTGDGVAVAGSFRGTLTGLESVGRFVRTRQDKRVSPSSSVAAMPRPEGAVFSVPEGTMLGFDASMKLLESAGIRVADYRMLYSPDDPAPDFEGPYVAKLADVAHRTEINAVRVGVTLAELPDVVRLLQGIAAVEGVPSAVAVQRMVPGVGEAFIGVQGQTELGPLVAFGLGGVFVEVLKRVEGLIAPFTTTDAEEIISEFDSLGVVAGHRGKPAWPREALAELLVRVGHLAAGGRAWIESIDLNPVIVTSDGLIAVDALLLLRQPES